MTPANRWKLVSLVLAGCLSYTWWHGEAASNAPSGQRSHSRVDGKSRLSAAMLGMSKDELVRRLFDAKDVDEIRELAERLGAIGDDKTIDAVMPLVADARSGVPEAIVAAFGDIATEHAVDVLIELTRDSREEIQVSAVDALGHTRSPRGEPVLIEIAQRSGHEARTNAISALAEIASERGIEVIAQIANSPDDDGEHAMRALGEIDKPAARAAIVRLVDASSLTVAAQAIAQLGEADLDAEMMAKLAGIISGGDEDLVPVALGALAKAGAAALPGLREAALRGAVDTRISAINALATIDDPQVIDTLRSILDSESGRIADAAADMLGSIDSDEAREALISAALADETGGSRAFTYLMRQTGPEVEQAMLVIAKSESTSRWDAVEHLVSAGNAEALALAIGEARAGTPDRRIAAMQALADAGTEPAMEALVELVQQSGEVKGRALEILGEARPDDPVVAKMLREGVHSRDPDEAAAAASALARVGTPEARDALVAALRSTDAKVAENAADSLEKFRLTDEVTAALREAASSHPELKFQLMAQLVSGGSPVGLELAKQALDGDSEQARRAISVLERAGRPEAVELLVKSTRLTDPQVRAEAVAALGSNGDKRGAEVVAQALRDSEPTVRHAAARTLGQLHTTHARDQLIGMTRSADIDDRHVAVTNLRRFEDAESTRRLTELVRDPNPSVAYSAIDAVAERADALTALRGFLTDAGTSRDLRRQAATVLSYRGVTDPLIDQLLDADAE